MPRKAKDTLENNEVIEKVEKKKTTRKVASSSKKASTSKKEEASTSKNSKTKAEKKPSSSKKVSTRKVAASSSTATKKTSTTKKSTVKKEATKKNTVKKNNSKKSASEKGSSKKEVSSVKTRTRKTSTKIKSVVAIPEYYDLPYHYNQTVVKILAQTPKTLFVYWDVSEEDTQNYISQFGPDFFNNTIPFLRVINTSNGKYYDVDVDDFANGWYLHVEDSKNNYIVELHRRQRDFATKVINEPIYISSSNIIETPNDHILLDTNTHTIFYKDVKTGKITSKDIAQVSLLKKIGKIYNIYDLYKRIYKNENISELFDLNNPSSSNPTSTFK